MKAKRPESRSEDRRLFESCFREEKRRRRVREQEGTLFFSDIASRVQSPNKTPEPTLGAAEVFGNSVVFHLAAGVAHL